MGEAEERELLRQIIPGKEPEKLDAAGRMCETRKKRPTSSSLGVRE
jgi:hypothetical protein